MLNLSITILAAVVDQALRDAAQHPRWVSAIRRAFEELDSNPFIERQADHPGLIIGSSSGNAYAANGTCSCQAFAYGRPCWHRAAARLVRLHDEAQTAPAAGPSLAQRIAAARQAADELNAAAFV